MHSRTESEEPAIVGDSTSDDTISSSDESDPESNPQAVVASDEDRIVAELCRPLTRLMPDCQKEST